MHVSSAKVRERDPWENKRFGACAGHSEEPEPCVRIQVGIIVRRARTKRRCDMLLLLCHMIMPISMVNLLCAFPVAPVRFGPVRGQAPRKFSRKEFHTV